MHRAAAAGKKSESYASDAENVSSPRRSNRSDLRNLPRLFSSCYNQRVFNFI
jgi:hypothetical protein